MTKLDQESLERDDADNAFESGVVRSRRLVPGLKVDWDHLTGLRRGGEIKKYSPDQPRDDHGRFGAGGSPSDQVAAVRDYTGVGHGLLNDHLRGVKNQFTPSPEEHEKKAAGIDEYIARHQITQPVTVYRSVGGDVGYRLRQRFDQGKIGPGSTFKDSGFVSTSTDKETEGTSGKNPGRDVTLHIDLRPGDKATDVSGVSEHPDENEVLIGRGTTFRVKSYSDGVAHLEVVPERKSWWSRLGGK